MLHYCTRPVEGQFLAPSESAVGFCCIFTRAPLHILIMFLCFMLCTELLVQCDGCLSWSWVWWVGLVAGLWVGQACRVFLLPGFRVSSSSPQDPGHSTYICDSDIITNDRTYLGFGRACQDKHSSPLRWHQLHQTEDYKQLGAEGKIWQKEKDFNMSLSKEITQIIMKNLI